MSLQRLNNLQLKPIGDPCRYQRSRKQTIDYPSSVQPLSPVRSQKMARSVLRHYPPTEEQNYHDSGNIRISLQSNQSNLMRRRNLFIPQSGNSQVSLSENHNCPHCKQPMSILGQNFCPEHQIEYELIGKDAGCNHQCLICCQCLKEDHHQHKRGEFNHQTIAIAQLNKHLNKIKNQNITSIQRCLESLDFYINYLKQVLSNEIRKEEDRARKFIESIMFTQITTKNQQLLILQKLSYNQFGDLTCQQVSSVAEKLLKFKPQVTSPGYDLFTNYLEKRKPLMHDSLKAVFSFPDFQSVVLKDLEAQTDYPNWNVPTSPTSPPNTANAESRKSSVSLPKTVIPKTKYSPKKPKPQPLLIKSRYRKPSISISHPVPKKLDFLGSEIVRYQQDVEFIEKLFDTRRAASAKMLYRASDHNFSIKVFHQLCDNYTDTVVFARTEFKKVIGGFSTIPWKSSKNTMHSDINKQCFLFSLSLKQKMPLLDSEKAIFNSISHGPTFGAGADLSICHKANTSRQSYANFPLSYGNPRYKQSHDHDNVLFSGQTVGKHFNLEQWEVWKLQFKRD